jgi:hypothetical protein
MSETTPKPALALVRDLMFTSKITATANAVGTPVKIVRDPGKLSPTEPGRLLLVDLNQPGTLDAAVAWMTQQGGPVVGFVSHVDRATIDQARQVGLTRVMPRSQFVAELEEMLKG